MGKIWTRFDLHNLLMAPYVEINALFTKHAINYWSTIFWMIYFKDESKLSAKRITFSSVWPTDKFREPIRLLTPPGKHRDSRVSMYKKTLCGTWENKGWELSLYVIFLYFSNCLSSRKISNNFRNSNYIF